MKDHEQRIDTLTELNEALENYFRNTIIPQLFVDADLVLRKFTPPAMLQFKLSEGDVGRPIQEISDNFRFPSILENIATVMQTGRLLEKEIQTTDMRWYQMNILPYIVRRTAKTDGVIITFVEITMRIHDLKEQEKLIAEHEILLDTISHDIKTPLTSLGMSVQLLKKLPEKGMQHFPKLLVKIENSLSKMQAIVAELTDSRQSAHRYMAVAELLDVEHILEDVRLTLAPQILQSGAVIQCNITHSEIVFVRRKLRSLLYNLLSNSIKYCPSDRFPLIDISTWSAKGQMVIRISDNGVGIGPDHLEKVFTKYERLANDVEGTGIGLFLVREIVELSGGRVTVESEPGSGSTFTVYLGRGTEEVKVG